MRVVIREKSSGLLYRGWKIPGRDTDPPDEMVHWLAHFEHWEGDEEGIVVYESNLVIEEPVLGLQGTDYVVENPLSRQLRIVHASRVEEGLFTIEESDDTGL